MALWTDIIDPATLSGYVRAALADYEARKGTLARWLPNRNVASISVTFQVGSKGLVPIAKFRAFDAPPEIGRKPKGRTVTLELPALGQDIPISEYDRLRANGAQPSDDAILRMIQTTARQVARAIADAIERMRGVVLATGKATIDQDNFFSDDDFGRSPEHSDTVAPVLWSDGTADGLGNLEAWSDVYRDTNGEDPGAVVMSTRAFRAFAGLDQMQNQLLNGVSRPASQADVQAVVTGAGMPDIYRFDRRVMLPNGTTVKALPDDIVLLLPAPVDPTDPDAWEETELGATIWGRTLSSTEADWAIDDDEQPGIVAGVWKHDKPPHGAEVIGDGIGLPALANADLSFKARVL